MADGSLFLLDTSSSELTPGEAAMFRTLQPAGYLLTEQNIQSPAQVRKLTDDLRDLSTDTPVIAIRLTGGTDIPTRSIAPVPPPPSSLAARKDLGKIADAGALTGDLLRLLGINLNLAPVLALGRFPAGGNCDCQPWSRDGQRVIDYAGQWSRWMRKRGVACCACGFPGGGRADPCCHPGAPSAPATLDELLREDVIPYTALMPEIDALMPSHVEFPAIETGLPASLSPRIIRRFLRDQLGFDQHLVLTDAPGIPHIAARFGAAEAARLAIEAGNDLVIIQGSVEPALDALSGLPHWMIDDAELRLDRFRKKKLHGPLKWSDEAWRSTCAALDALSREFSGADEV